VLVLSVYEYSHQRCSLATGLSGIRAIVKITMSSQKWEQLERGIRTAISVPMTSLSGQQGGGGGSVYRRDSRDGVTIALSCIICELFHVEYCDLENWLRGLSRSLKLMPFKSLSAVSYSPSIATMAVSAAILEIFSVKEWPDLEILVWGPSRSLKKSLFDRPCRTFY